MNSIIQSLNSLCQSVKQKLVSGRQADVRHHFTVAWRREDGLVLDPRCDVREQVCARHGNCKDANTSQGGHRHYHFSCNSEFVQNTNVKISSRQRLRNINPTHIDVLNRMNRYMYHKNQRALAKKTINAKWTINNYSNIN